MAPKDSPTRIIEAYAMLSELSRIYLKDGNLDYSIEETVRKLNRFFRPDFINILLPDEGGETLSVRASNQNTKTNISVPLRDDNPAGYAFLRKKPLITSDVSKVKDLQLTAPFDHRGLRSGMCIPMLSGDEAVGVISLCFKRTLEIPEEEVNVLRTAANNLSVYMKKEKTIQEAMASRDFLTSILEGIGEGVIVVDRQNGIISTNRSFCRQVGMNCEEIIGKRCFHVSHGYDKPCYEMGEDCPVKDTLGTGEARRVVHRHHDADGNPLFVEIAAYPLKNMEGSVYAAVEVITDITTRHTLELELKRRVKELEDFYDLAVEREIKMAELKEQNEEMKERLSKL